MRRFDLQVAQVHLSAVKAQVRLPGGKQEREMCKEDWRSYEWKARKKIVKAKYASLGPPNIWKERWMT